MRQLKLLHQFLEGLVPKKMTERGVLLMLSYLAFFSNSGCVDSSKILAVPVDGSHWNTMKVLILELKAKGHQITVLRFSNYLNIDDQSPDFSIVTVQLPDSQARTKEEKTQAALSWIFYNAFSKESCSTSAFWQLFVSMKRIGQDYKLAIETMFENSMLMRQLQETNFDVVLADTFFPGGVMLARYLNLPNILFGRWMPTEDIHFRIAPSPLAYVPVLNSRLTDRMSFFQRLKNVVMYASGNILYHFFIYSTYNDLCSQYLEPGVTIYTLYAQADVYLMKFDFALDFLKPGMPNIIYIGGFHTKPPKPLPLELKGFMDGAEDGVVVLSLGSIVNTLPEAVAAEIAAGLALLPQRVVWRYAGPPIPTLGNNTKLLKWLPQNDLLSHPNTRAFITHGGENSIYEAIYHGVPIVGFPLFGDNYENLLRLSVKGVAVLLSNLNRLSRQDVLAAVRTVTEDPTFRDNMKKLSRVHRDTPISPKDLAIFWTEYVIRNKGAQHLRAAGNDLPFHQYWLLDVLAFISVLVILFVYSSQTLLKILWKKLKGRLKVKRQ